MYICTWAIAAAFTLPAPSLHRATLGGQGRFDHNGLIKIGERLREARGRRGLGLADAAAQLNLHPKYLRALEWERFDLLPSPQEAGEYLRSYAELLGLDGDVDLDQVDARAPEEEAPVPTRRGRSRVVSMSLLAGCVLAVAAVVAGQQLSRDESQESRPPPAPASVIPEDGAPVAAEPTAPMPAPSPEPPAAKTKRPPAPARLVVAAARGDSWVEARSGSADGPLLYRGNLEHGRSIRVAARRVWLRLGAASNLDLTLNGRKTGTSLFGTVDVTFGPRSP